MLAIPFLLSLALTIAPALSLSILSKTSILVPLYPGPSTNKWLSVYNTISSHPDIPFHIIVNPNSGPGDEQYPNEDYFTSVAKLNSYGNVQVIGYVRTAYTGRDISEVKKDVTSYSSWASKGTKNTTLSGIFFDETTIETDAGKISYMKEISDFAKSKNLPFVVFNPGTQLQGSADEYYKAASLIVEFENSVSQWANFSPEQSSQQRRSQQAAIVYGATSDDQYSEIVQDAQKKGLGAVYLTNSSDYMTPATVEKVAAAFVSQ